MFNQLTIAVELLREREGDYARISPVKENHLDIHMTAGCHEIRPWQMSVGRRGSGEGNMLQVLS